MQLQRHKLIALIKIEPDYCKLTENLRTKTTRQEKRGREEPTEQQHPEQRYKRERPEERAPRITSFRTPSQIMHDVLKHEESALYYLGEEPKIRDLSYIPTREEEIDYARTQKSNGQLGQKKPALSATVIGRKKAKHGTTSTFLGKENTNETEPIDPRKCYSTFAHTPRKKDGFQYRRVEGFNLSLIERGTTARGTSPLTVSKAVPGFYDHSKLHGAPINTYMVQAHLIANSLGIPQQDTELLVPTSQKYNRDKMGRVEKEFFRLAQRLGKIEKLEVNLTQVNPLSENGLEFFREAGVKFVRKNSPGIENYDERVVRYCDLIIRHLDGLWEQIATGSFWPVTKFEMSAHGIRRSAGKDDDWGIPYSWTKGQKGAHGTTQETPKHKQDKHLRHPSVTPGLLASTNKTASLKSRLFTEITPGLSAIKRINFLERYKTALFNEIRRCFPAEPPKELHISRRTTKYPNPKEKRDPLKTKLFHTPTKFSERPPFADIGNAAGSSAA